MAAPIANDRKLAAEVRRLALDKIKVILSRPAVEMSERDKELHDEILKKLAGTVLPRLSEVTGEDGGPINVNVLDPQSKAKLDALLNGKDVKQTSPSESDRGDAGGKELPV